MKRFFLISILFFAPVLLSAQQRYPVRAMVLSVDPAHNTFTASCDAIPGLMKAMTMPFEVRDSKDLSRLARGTIIEFILVVARNSSYAEHIQVRPYQTLEQDPWTARQLKLLSRFLGGAKASPKPVEPGQAVPDFTLTDQAHQQVSLSQLRGKVVALNFIYTSCVLPTFCYRMANNFGVLQRRFENELGRDLVLLTVSFDPQHDTPEVLAHYALTWKADSKTWHFLTGQVPEVRHVTDAFGMDFFPDEGLMDHSLHTAILDRDGKLVANIEGNQYTPQQLGDLVWAALNDRQRRQEVTVHHQVTHKTVTTPDSLPSNRSTSTKLSP